MEFPLHLHRHHWERRSPDWFAAAVAGLAGGAVLMVLELLWAAAMDAAGPWRVSQLVAALVLGPGVLEGSAFTFAPGVVAVALLTHYALGIVFGLVLGFAASSFGREEDAWVIPYAGALFGALLYLFNFYVMVQFFPWFTELRGWPTLIAHLVFGVAVALLYRKLARGGGSSLRQVV
jgi:hypothetical protein